MNTGKKLRQSLLGQDRAVPLTDKGAESYRGLSGAAGKAAPKQGCGVHTGAGQL